MLININLEVVIHRENPKNYLKICKNLGTYTVKLKDTKTIYAKGFPCVIDKPCELNRKLIFICNNYRASKMLSVFSPSTCSELRSEQCYKYKARLSYILSSREPRLKSETLSGKKPQKCFKKALPTKWKISLMKIIKHWGNKIEGDINK